MLQTCDTANRTYEQGEPYRLFPLKLLPREGVDRGVDARERLKPAPRFMFTDGRGVGRTFREGLER